jgi:hypothetical protein
LRKNGRGETLTRPCFVAISKVRMKIGLLLGILAMILCSSFAARPAGFISPGSDPCLNENSNAGMSSCYEDAQRRINALARSYTNQIVAENLRAAKTAGDGPVVAGLQGKTVARDSLLTLERIDELRTPICFKSLFHEMAESNYSNQPSP